MKQLRPDRALGLAKRIKVVEGIGPITEHNVKRTSGASICFEGSAPSTLVGLEDGRGCGNSEFPHPLVKS